jgi:hypothetical protein
MIARRRCGSSERFESRQARLAKLEAALKVSAWLLPAVQLLEASKS